MASYTQIIQEFVKKVASEEIEIYNEFSLQHELGSFLRAKEECTAIKIQFERPISFFGNFEKNNFIKKEIDIVIFSENKDGTKTKEAIFELKFPKNGQYPEQMFSFCKDICFCEQLKQKIGFKSSYFLVFVDDKKFYEGKNNKGIYQFFRQSPQQEQLKGAITKPTGEQNETITLTGSYNISWESIEKSNMRYALVEIKE